jgi:hypothetical protein
MVRPPHLPKGGISQLWCALGLSSLGVLNMFRGDSKCQCRALWTPGGHLAVPDFVGRTSYGSWCLVVPNDRRAASPGAHTLHLLLGAVCAQAGALATWRCRQTAVLISAGVHAWDMQCRWGSCKARTRLPTDLEVACPHSVRAQVAPGARVLDQRCGGGADGRAGLAGAGHCRSLNSCACPCGCGPPSGPLLSVCQRSSACSVFNTPQRTCTAGTGRHAGLQSCQKARSARLARAHCWQREAQMLCWTCTLGIQIFLPLTVLGIGVGDRPALPHRARVASDQHCILCCASRPLCRAHATHSHGRHGLRSASVSMRPRARSAADQPPGQAARLLRQWPAAAAGAGLPLRPADAVQPGAGLAALLAALCVRVLLHLLGHVAAHQVLPGARAPWNGIHGGGNHNAANAVA